MSYETIYYIAATRKQEFVRTTYKSFSKAILIFNRSSIINGNTKKGKKLNILVSIQKFFSFTQLAPSINMDISQILTLGTNFLASVLIKIV